MKTKKALITLVAVIAFLLLLTAAPAALPSEVASAIPDSGGNMNSTITIHNSGDHCSSIWIYYKEEGNCELMRVQHIEMIAPGEAIRVGAGPDADVPFPSAIAPPWLGSAYITANEPLAIVVNQRDADSTMLLSHAGVPYPDYGDTTNYAPLVYRAYDGWNAEIYVHNLTQESQPTFVTVDFFDQDGDEILFVGDWVCRNGTTTFYVRDFTDLGINLPFGYFGAAEIQSHEEVDYPGGLHPGEPIASVISLINSDSGEALSYNAFPSHQVTGVTTLALPLMSKQSKGRSSEIAIRNNSNCNKIRGKIWIWDETGTSVGAIDVPWLDPKHLKIIDLADQEEVPPGFVGAATFEVLEEEQLCDVDNDGYVDDQPIMPSVVVLDSDPDDSASGQEGFPIKADPNTRIQLPAIDADDGWETWIHTQNVGDDDTGAVVFFWGEYSGLCPTNSPGPVAVACERIVENGIWILQSAIPAEAKAAIIYSVDKDVFEEACREATGSIDGDEAWRNWDTTYAYSGKPLAVTVNRLAYDGSSASGMYNGFSETMVGSGPASKYFAFPVMHGYSKPPPATVDVPVDIKPQSCPNPLNVKSKGVLPVAILGTADFDVTEVDTELVQLELVGVNPIRVAFEDVATPFEPFIGKEDPFDCTTEGPDGFLDLTLKFDTQAVVQAIGPVEDGDVLVLQLTGKLKDEFGGTPIVGEDVVVILKKGKE